MIPCGKAMRLKERERKREKGERAKKMEQERKYAKKRRGIQMKKKHTDKERARGAYRQRKRQRQANRRLVNLGRESKVPNENKKKTHVGAVVLRRRKKNKESRSKGKETCLRPLEKKKDNCL